MFIKSIIKCFDCNTKRSCMTLIDLLKVFKPLILNWPIGIRHYYSVLEPELQNKADDHKMNCQHETVRDRSHRTRVN